MINLDKMLHEIETFIKNEKNTILKVFHRHMESDFFKLLDKRIIDRLNNNTTGVSTKSLLADFYYQEDSFYRSFRDMLIKKLQNKYTINDSNMLYIAEELIDNVIADKYELIVHQKLQTALNNTGILSINEFGNTSVKNSKNKLIAALYKEIKSYIKNNIKFLFPKITDIYTFSLNYNTCNAITDKLSDIDWQTLQNRNLSNLDKHKLIDTAFRLYKPELKEYLISYTEKNKSDKNIKAVIYLKLTEYINNNLRKIFLTFKLARDNNDDAMYIQSWLDTDGSLDGGEYEYIKRFLLKHKNNILHKININKKYSLNKWQQLIDEYLTNYYPELEYKIHDLISYKNEGTRKKRSNDLAALIDKVNDKTYINYDPTADHVRTRPIIIVRDKNTNKDHVMFGPKGASHGYYIENKLYADAAENNIDIDPYVMGYGYLLGRIAFVDEQGDNYLFGYTNDQIVDILKDDPRIVKVYQTASHPMPGGGLVKRLAKLKYYAGINDRTLAFVYINGKIFTGNNHPDIITNYLINNNLAEKVTDDYFNKLKLTNKQKQQEKAYMKYNNQPIPQDLYDKFSEFDRTNIDILSIPYTAGEIIKTKDKLIFTIFANYLQKVSIDKVINTIIKEYPNVIIKDENNNILYNKNDNNKNDDIKVSKIYINININKYQYDLDIFKELLLKYLNQYIIDLNISINYNEIDDDDYLGNNVIWPIIISLTYKTLYQKEIKNILNCLLNK